MHVRSVIQQELMETQTQFHGLIQSLEANDWQSPIPNSKWNVGEMLTHIVGSMGFFAYQIKQARQGKGIPRLIPPAIINPVNELMVKRAARQATPEMVLARYDSGHQTLMRLLATIRPDEWDKSGTFFGEAWTVRHVFGRPKEHFQEHAAHITTALDR